MSTNDVKSSNNFSLYLLQGDWIKPGAVVIDCGITAVPGVYLLFGSSDILCLIMRILFGKHFLKAQLS